MPASRPRHLVHSPQGYSVSCVRARMSVMFPPQPGRLPRSRMLFHPTCYRSSGSSDLISSLWCQCVYLQSCVEMGLQHVSLLMLACPGRHLGSGMLLFSVPTSVFTSLIFFFKGAMDFMILFSFYDDQKRDNAGCGFSLLSVSRSLIIWYCSSQKPAERFLNKNIISCYFHGFLFNVYHF